MAAKHGEARMLPEKEHNRHLLIHRQKMHRMPAQIDNTAPPTYLHLELRLKQLEKEEQRKREIDRNNMLLLTRMADIMNDREDKFNRNNNNNKKRSKSLNMEQRQKEHDRLERDNVRVARRIEGTKPTYKVDDWEKDYKQKQELKESWQRQNQRKKSPSRQPGHNSKGGNRRDHSKSGSSSDTDEEKRDKLPPIKSAQPRSSNSQPGTARSTTPRSQGSATPRRSRSAKKGNPDRELWMYYGIRPGASDDEDDFYNKSPYLDPKKEKERRRKHNEGKNMADLDAKQLYKVAKRMAPPHDIITRTLAKKPYQHRENVKEKYKEHYDVELEQDLKTGLGSEWNVLIEGLLNEPSTGQGKSIGKTVRGGDAVAIVKKVTPLSTQELKSLKEEYEKENSTSLESDISENFKNPVETFLLTLVKGNKKEKSNKEEAEKDAKELLESDDDRWTSSSGKFFSLLKNKSTLHMRMVFENFKKLNRGRPANKSVQEECPKQYAEAVSAYINCTETASTEQADFLHKNMDPTNPDFVKTVIAKSETDLQKVRKVYKKKYGNEMADDLEERSNHTTVGILRTIITKDPPKPKDKNKQAKKSKEKKKSSDEDEGSHSSDSDDDKKKDEDKKKSKEDSDDEKKKKAERDKKKSKEDSDDEKKKKAERDKKKSKEDSDDEKKKKAERDKKKSKEDSDDEKKKKAERDKKKSKEDSDDDKKKKDAKDKKNDKEGDKKNDKDKNDPDEDAQRLYKAMKGLGTDEAVITEIIPHRTNAQRQQIKKKYEELYKKDLEKDLKSELSGDFQEVILALMMPPADYEVYSLNQAMQGAGTDESVLIGILCSKSPAEIDELKKSYKKAYKKDLESDIKKDTSGDFKDMLVQLLSGKKDGDSKADKGKAEEDAKALHENPKSDVLKNVFSKKNPDQIKLMAEAHQKLFNEDISVSIKKASAGDAEAAYLALVKAQGSDADFYAERLHMATKGLGTNDTQLINIIVARSEIDLKDITSKYQQLYGSSLKKDVEGETSGDYRKTLLALLGESEEKGEKQEKKGGQQEKKGGQQEKKGGQQEKKSESKVEKAEVTKVKQVKSEEGEKKRDVKEAEGEKEKKEKERQEKEKKEREKKEKQEKEKEKQEKEKEREKQEKVKQEKEKDKKEKSKDDDKINENDEDAVKLYKAMKGLGTKEDVVIEVIVRNSNAERQTLKKRYEELYKKDLVKDLDSELSGDFKETILALMMPPVQYDAYSLNKAMKGFGTDEGTLIDILCTKTPAELEDLKKLYKKEYNTDLYASVKKETSGDLRDILLQKLGDQKDKDKKDKDKKEKGSEAEDKNKDKATKVDQKKAEEDAKSLHEKPSSDLVKSIFKESPEQITATADAHKKLFNEDITESIKKACSGDTETAYLSILKSQGDQTEFFAERLNASMKGLGTNDATLIRTLVSRSELDLPAIKGQYQQLYGHSLKKDVESDTSGDYKKTLVKIIDKVKEEKPKKEEAQKEKARAQSPGKSAVKEEKPSDLKAKNVQFKEEKKDEKKEIKKEEKKDEKKEIKKEEKADVKGEHAKPKEEKKEEKVKDKKDEKKEEKKDDKKDKEQKKEQKKEEKKDDDKINENDEDAVKLYKAMKGLGTDEDVVIEVIVRNSNAERQTLKKRYKELYKKELVKELDSELSGDFKETILGLMMPPVDYDAYMLNSAMKGLGTDEGLLVSIVCTKTPAQLKEISQNYKKEYKKDLESEIKKETKGDLKDLLLECFAEKKEKSAKLDEDKAKADAKLLHEKPSADVVKTIFKGSPEQIAATAEAHKELFKEDLKESIKKAKCGESEQAYLALLSAPDDPSLLYAESLYNAMKGLGTKDKQLISIVVARSEIDLALIKGQYQQLYGNSLKKDVEGDTSGDYKKTLVKIIDKVGEEKPPAKKSPEKKAPVKEQPRSKSPDKVVVKEEKKDVHAKNEEKKDVKKEEKKDIKVDKKEEKKEDKVIIKEEKPKEKKEEKKEVKKEEKKDDKKEKDKKDEKEQKKEEKKEEKKDDDKINENDEDAVKLYKAMKGLGTKEDVIIEVIVRNSNSQRQTLKKRYAELYKKDLVKDLDSELSGEFKETILGLMMPPVDFDAYSLNKAMKGLGTDESTLISIICSKPQSELEEIKKVYKKEYKKDLDSVVKKETSGDFQEILLQRLNGKKDKNSKEPDNEKAEKDAKTLHENLSASVVKEIFKGGPDHFKATSAAHKELFNEDIIESIKKACSGDAESAYLAIAKAQDAPAAHYAESLKKSMAGLGTNDSQLIYLLVSHLELDLPLIKGHYQQLYGHSLKKDVESDTSGDYKKTLVKIIDKVGEEKPPAKKTEPVKEKPRSQSPAKGVLIMERSKDTKATNEKKEEKKETKKEEKKDEPQTPVKAAVVAAKPKENQVKNEKVQQNEEKKEENKDEKKGKDKKDEKEQKKEEKKEEKKDDDKINENDEDAVKLYKAMKGLGTKEDVIIEVIVRNSNAQRQNLKKRYTELYKKDLVKDLDSELSGDFKETILALMMSPVDYDAYSLNKAMKGVGTDEGLLTNIICTRSADELKEIAKVYKKSFKNDLESDVKKETSGDFKDLLILCLSGKQGKDSKVDEKKAEENARALHETPKASIVKDIFKSSPAQITATANSHQQLYDEHIAEAIKKANCGEAETAYLAILKAQGNQSEFYAERLNSSMKGLGTKDTQLINILVSQSELALPAIKGYYQQLYGHSLKKDVESDTSGDYKKTLVKIIDKVGEEKPPAKKSPEKKAPVKEQPRSKSPDKVVVKEEKKDVHAKNEEKKEVKKEEKKDVKVDKKEEKKEDKVIIKEEKPKEKKEEKKEVKKEEKKDDKKEKDKKDEKEQKKEEKKEEKKDDDKINENDEDAVKLYKAMKGLGTKEDVIIEVIVRNSNAQRQTLKKRYNELYKKDLVKDLDSELSGDFKETILGLMMPPAEFDAHILNKAMKGLGTDESVLTTLICSKSTAELQEINKVYKKAYKKDLESDIKKETSGDYKELLLQLIGGKKDKGSKLDQAKAESDAKTIHDQPSAQAAKEIFKGTFEQINATASAHKNLFDEDLSESIKKASCGDAETGYLALLNSQEKPLFFAEKLNNAMKGMGTKDTQLIYTLVARSESDLPAIKGHYQQLYGHSLKKDVESDTSGDYKKTLVKIIDKIGEEKPPAKKNEPAKEKPQTTAKAAVVAAKPKESQAKQEKVQEKEVKRDEKKDLKEEKKEVKKEEKKDDKKEKEQKKEEKKDDDKINENDEDAVKLYKAMKGLGTIEDVIIEVIVRNSNAQRQTLKKRYNELYKKDLVKDLDSELSGDFKETILGLMMPPVEYDAYVLNKAMKGLGTNEVVLNTVICSKTSAEISEISKVYKNAYKKDLETEIKKETSGDYKDILLQLIGGKKDKDSKVDQAKADSDAKSLHEKPSADILKGIFKGNMAQIKATANSYKEMFDEHISVPIKKASCGDAEGAYIALVKSEDKSEFYAESLNYSMKGPGTNEDLLTSTIVSRSELDLPLIKGQYQQLYGNSLKKDVESDTSGDYKKTLVKIIDKVGEEKPPAKKEEPKNKKADEKGSEKAVAVVKEDKKEVQAKKDKEEKKEERKEEKKEEKKVEKKEEKKEEKKDEQKEEKKDDDKINENDEDAVKLYKAMKGLGTKEDVIIEVIVRNSNAQRQTLKKRYNELYKKDLVKDLDSELSGDFKEAILGLMMPPAELDAYTLNKAMKGFGCDESTLITVLIAKKPAELEEVKKEFKKEYKKDLESEIQKETKGDFKDLLKELMSGKKEKNAKVDKDKAEKEAKTLHEQPSPSVVKDIFLQSSSVQLKAVADAHKQLYSEDISESIKKASSGDAEETYLALVQVQQNETEFFAQRLHGSMKGLGTKETQLTWLLVSRLERDLPAIKGKYRKLTHNPLRQDVEGETSGDYKKTLLAIIDKVGEVESKDEEKVQQSATQSVNQQKAEDEKNKEQKDQKKDDNEEKKEEKEDNEIKENDEDAVKLYKAMKGLGTKEDIIIEIIVRNSNSQRQTLKKRYEELYKKDLVKDLDSELSGDFKETILSLMMSPVEFDAYSLNKGMQGLGCDEDTLIDIICTKSESELEEIKKEYKKTYSKELDGEVKKETKGDLKDLLLQLLSGKREKAAKNDKKAEEDAKALHEKPSVDNLKKIILKNSPEQVNATAASHKKLYSEDISESIKKASSGDTEKAYLAIVKSLGNQSTYFTERLNNAMKGIGTKETQLIRILVSRSEVDLPVIKGKYKKLYEHPLRQDVESETSGDYRKTLLKIIDKVGEVEDKSVEEEEEDAKQLYKAMHKVGTDEDTVIKVITRNSNADRQKLKTRYQELYKQDLMKDLRSELSGDFEDNIIAMMMPAVDYDAYCLHEAMKGLKTDKITLIGIICSKNYEEMQAIKEVYKQTYKKDLELEIVMDTSGDFRELLLQLVTGKRDQSSLVNKSQADEDAKLIHEKPSAETLRRILVNSSHAHVMATADAHRKLYNEDILDSIKKASHGDTEDAYLALVKALQDQTNFFTESIHSSIKGLGTNDKQLIRILVSRSEVDLPAISTKYQEKYSKSLRSDVESDTSGDYRKTLLSIITVWGGDQKLKESPTHQISANNERPKSSKGHKAEGHKDEGDEPAVRLNKAMAGAGTDEDTVIDIITKCSNADRQNLKKRFQELYKKDLIKELQKELKGDFEEVILALMMTPVDFDAHSLNEAMKGLGTDEAALISILCSKTSAEIEEIKKAYKKAYKKDLDSEIKKETSGDFKDLLLHLISDKRDSDTKVNAEKAEKHAKELREKPSSEILSQIFAKSSREQIAATADAHKRLFNENITESIKKASSGDAEAAYIAITKALEDPTTFFTERIHNAMSELGKNDTNLIRTIVSRSEIDLPAIKSKYAQLYGKPLKDAVASDTSGNCTKVLVKLIEK